MQMEFGWPRAVCGSSAVFGLLTFHRGAVTTFKTAADERKREWGCVFQHANHTQVSLHQPVCCISRCAPHPGLIVPPALCQAGATAL